MAYTVKEGVDEWDLSQNPQPSDTKFACVHLKANGDMVRTTPYFKCRDFIGDVVWSYLDGNNRMVYGFESRKGMVPEGAHNGRFHLLFEGTDQELVNLHTNLLLLTEFERLNKLKQTTVSVVTDNERLLSFSTRWTIAPFMLSFYSLLIRTLSRQTFNENTLWEALQNFASAEGDSDQRLAHTLVSNASLSDIQTLLHKAKTIYGGEPTGGPPSDANHVTHDCIGIIHLAKYFAAEKKKPGSVKDDWVGSQWAKRWAQHV